MFPSSAMNEVPDVLRRESVLAAHIALLRAIGNGVANFHDLCLGQFGVSVVLAPSLSGAESSSGWIAIATLVRAIGVVLRNGAKKQMRRIATRWVVASVTHTQALWYRANSERVGNAVRSVAVEDSVAPGVFGAHPFPALRWLANLNFRPESRLLVRINHI